jgi:uncharacterized protein YkwD
MLTRRAIALYFCSSVGVFLLLASLPIGALSTSASLPAGSPNSRLAVGAHQASFDTLRTLSRHVFRETNEVRRERDLSLLQRDSTLAEVACSHNADMFRRDFFDHVNPDGKSPHDRVARMHRRLVGGVSENLYSQDRFRKDPAALAAEMVERWMGSPPHRKNILSSLSTHLGVCVLQQGTGFRATQVFARVVGYLTPPLPHTAARGSVLAVSVEATGASSPNIARYDFWDPRTNRRISEPALFVDSLRVPDTTGTLRPRFYTVGAGEYVLYRGPDLTIVNAPTSPSR